MQLIQQRHQNNSMGKKQSQHGARITTEKNEVRSHLTLYTQINSKKHTDLDVRVKTIKLFKLKKKNVTVISQQLLRYNTKSTKEKSRETKMNKNLNFYVSKGTIKVNR